MNDEFRTIEAGCSAETKVQGSRFIARIFPVDSKESAESILAEMRKEFHDATHHCYAYRIGSQGDQIRFSDDGEPSGTAGKPILVAIDKQGLTNILAVVIRYFGGTKLGTGGLSRSYCEATELAITRCKITVRYEMEPVIATFPHSLIGNVMRIVSKTRAEIIDTQHDEEVHLRLAIRRSRTDELKQDLVNATSGNVRFSGG